MLFMRISYFIYVFMRISYFIYVFMKTKKMMVRKNIPSDHHLYI